MNAHTFVVLAIVHALSFCAASARCSEPSEETHIVWPYPIAVPKGSAREVREVAELLRDKLHVELSVVTSDRNPLCCIWLDVASADDVVQAAPSFIVAIKRGAGRIIADDPKHLRAAADELLRHVVWKNGRAYVPLGIITDYQPVKTVNASRK